MKPHVAAGSTVRGRSQRDVHASNDLAADLQARAHDAGAEKALAITLALAGVIIAVIQLAEPILFGRVVDALSRGGGAFSIIALWAALGLFGIIANVLVAVYSDRLAHRRRLAIMADVYERALALPQSYHAMRGSGTVIRTIVSGCSSLFWLWLGALREQLTSLFGIVCSYPPRLPWTGAWR